jgi:iron complex transport system substrate-binding protein
VRCWAVLLLLTGCAQVPPVPQLREAVDGPTIVSLNPCSDAILAQVTGPGQLLAISHYSHDPAATSMPLSQARAYRATGGTVEEVLALQPDVVVASSFLPPATSAAFQRLGIRVETVGVATSVEQSQQQVRQLAELAGQAHKGEVLVERIAAAWDAAAYSGAPVSTLLWQEGGIVPGPDSLIAQLLEHSGFALHSAARGLGQGAYLPLEQVLADPPALLLASADEPMLRHPALAQVPGLQRAQFDPALVYCGGPSIIAALERLGELR